MTLQFYSAKAYKFVRKSFILGLPHPYVMWRGVHMQSCSMGWQEVPTVCRP